MKTALLTACLLLPVFCALGAPQPDSLAVEYVDRNVAGVDTLRRLDPLQGDAVQLRDRGDGKFLLEAGGFGLTFDRSYMSKAFERESFYTLSILHDFEFGFTQLSGVKYKGYAPGTEGFLDQELGASFHFGFTPLSIRRYLGRRRSSLELGMRYAVDNLRLTDVSFTLANDGRRIVPEALDAPAGKSKLRYSTLGLSLRFERRLARHLYADLSASADFLLAAKAITKDPVRKSSLSGLNPCQLGLSSSVTYYGIGFYVRYSPTSLFRASSGLEARPLSFGFVITVGK